MRVLFAGLFVTTLLTSSTAFGAAPAIPASAISPTNVPVYSNDHQLPNDDNLRNDAETLAGVEGLSPINPDQTRVNNDHNQIDRLNQKLKHDTIDLYGKQALKDDRTNIKNAQKQLKADQKTCADNLKKNGIKVDPQLQSTTCK